LCFLWETVDIAVHSFCTSCGQFLRGLEISIQDMHIWVFSAFRGVWTTMRRSGFALVVLSMLLPVAAAWAAALPQADSQGAALPSLAPMVERVSPAVVNISTSSQLRVQESPLYRDPFFRFFFDAPAQPRQRRAQSLGSGVIVDAERGYVLTNNHVVDRASEIRVTLVDGRQLTAIVVGADPEVDIAVLRIPAEDLTEILLADSDRLRVGDFVLAIGNPFGLGHTVTSGIVSALGRSGLGIEGFEDFIQTDASINPGNSGGPLVNLRGELVGINTAIIGPAGGNVGIGFAIPVNMAALVMEQLLEFGEVRRGQFGAAVQALTPELAQAFGMEQFRPGVVVTRVGEDTPAARAGLRSGDIIVSFNGRGIRNVTELRTAVGLLRVGDTVDIVYRRDGAEHKARLRIAPSVQERLGGETVHPRLAGALFGRLDESSPLYGKVEGVLVSEVAAGSPAQRGGLRPGDVLTSVNRRSVASLAELNEAAAAGGGRLLLNVRRGEAALFILLQ
jgi:serine protease Do/serine protease DegQ